MCSPLIRLLAWRSLQSGLLWLQDSPKLRVAIVGSGLAGLSTAVELLDQGHEVEVFESRPFIGGKVASWVKDGNHVEMGLHVVSSACHRTCSVLQHLHSFS